MKATIVVTASLLVFVLLVLAECAFKKGEEPTGQIIYDKCLALNEETNTYYWVDEKDCFQVADEDLDNIIYHVPKDGEILTYVDGDFIYEIPTEWPGIHLFYFGELYNCKIEHFDATRTDYPYPDNCRDDAVVAWSQQHMAMCCQDQIRVEIGLVEDGALTWRTDD